MVRFLSPPSSLHERWISGNAHLICRLQSQALSKGIKLERRHLSSIKDLLSSRPNTNLVLNATGLGALKLEDVRDTNVYPTRGQTVLVAEPTTPMMRMYELEQT